jgi:hypothetical protein
MDRDIYLFPTIRDLTIIRPDPLSQENSVAFVVDDGTKTATISLSKDDLQQLSQFLYGNEGRQA